MTTAARAPTRDFALDDYSCLEITGEDAESFLQGQLSNDVRHLPAGGGHLTTYNDPQGRVIALLRLFRTEAGFIACLPATLAGSVAARLGMFVMRARVSIQPTTHWRLIGVQGDAPVPAPDAPLLRLPSPTSLSNYLTGRESGSGGGTAQEWATLETRCGVPEVSPQTSGHFVAQMLRLDRLGALAFDKGCYVGQEIIARAHHLGRVKRHIRLYRVPGSEVSSGDTVVRSDEKVGEVARVAKDAGGRILLAVIRDDTAEPLATGTCELERLADPPAWG